MDGLPVGHGDERQVDLRLLGTRELDLGFLGRFFQAGQGLVVFGQVNAGVFLELLDHPVDDLLVEVVPTQLVVARRGLDLDLGLAVHLVDFEDGHVKGSSTQVVHENGLILGLVHSVGEGSGRGFVDDAQHVETCDAAGVFGGLSLGVGEVGRAGDDRLLHFVAQVGLRIGFQLLEDEGRNFLRRVAGVVHVGGPLRSHVSLDRNHGSIGVGHGLPLGGHADEAFATVFGKRHHRRGGACTFCVRDHHGFTVLDGGHAAVRCSKVNSNHFAHCFHVLQKMGMPPSSSSSSSSPRSMLTSPGAGRVSSSSVSSALP